MVGIVVLVGSVCVFGSFKLSYVFFVMVIEGVGEVICVSFGCEMCICDVD